MSLLEMKKTHAKAIELLRSGTLPCDVSEQTGLKLTTVEFLQTSSLIPRGD